MASRKAGVRVEGLKELNAALNRLESTARGGALESALNFAVEPIRAEWARLAPRSDTPSGTTGRGHAADAITVIVEHGTRHAEAHIGPPADFWYLVFAEFGTPHSAALAPGRRAADSKLGEAVERFRSELKGRVERAAR
jgi:hypothetical protein